MRRKALFLAAAVFALILAGCGGGDGGSTPQVFVSEALSDQGVDGFISQDVVGTLTLFPALTSGFISVGVDPFTFTEDRGFLDFPLVGKVPANAIVTYAFVEIFVNRIQVPPVPILIDLVEFTPPLITTDFFRSPPIPFLGPVATQGPVIIPLSAAGGPPVVIDVTSLVQLAIDRGDQTFQIRLFLDTFTAAGTIEIDDAAAEFAPLLHVEYL